MFLQIFLLSLNTFEFAVGGTQSGGRYEGSAGYGGRYDGNAGYGDRDKSYGGSGSGGRDYDNDNDFRGQDQGSC